MDFSVIFQLRTKKFWWMDVILYFIVSLFIATIVCFFIFSIKNTSQREEIDNVILSLKTVGTSDQLAEEKEVLTYQKKIKDFSDLLANHGFASNVFALMETTTIPNAWYKQFSLSPKNNEVQLSGESDSVESLSQQIAVLENTKNRKYIKNIGTLNSSLGQSGRVDFSTNLLLDKSIFDYLTTLSPMLYTETPANQSVLNMETPANQPTVNTGSENNINTTINQVNTPANSPTAPVQPGSGVKSSEKNITLFHLILKPEVIGAIDQKNYIVTLNVPYGTNVKNLISSIIVSPGATVVPASKISQDFTSPVTYRVTAEDGTVQAYQVKVVVAPPPQETEAPEKSESSLIFTIMYIALAVVVIAGVILLVWKKMASKSKNKDQQYAN